jgi:hypothetical protein
MFGAQHAPASVLPRLHAVLVERLPSVNPLLPRAQALPARATRLPCPGRVLLSSGAVLQRTAAEAPRLRQAALQCLSRALGGDDLAAEYLLLNLLSRTCVRPRARHGAMADGGQQGAAAVRGGAGGKVCAQYQPVRPRDGRHHRRVRPVAASLV